MPDKVLLAALRITGPVAVVAFLIWALLNHYFQPTIMSIFGDEKAFIITLIIVSGLLICLFTAILIYSSKRSKGDSKNTKEIKVMKSKIKGDVFIGNKNHPKDNE